MTGKTDKKFLFEVQLNWLVDKTGVLHAKDATGSIHVSTPPEFGGKGKPWTPEHLFLSSISSCYMTTFLAFAQKLDLQILNFDCDVIGQIEIVEGKYKFVQVDLYPRIYIADETLRKKAITAHEKSHKYCLITNSVNALMYYHSEILISQIPAASSSPAIPELSVNQ